MSATQADVQHQALNDYLENSEFDQLLSGPFKFKESDSKTEFDREREDSIKKAVKTLAQQALENVNVVSDNALDSIERLKAEIDKKLTTQINEIMHHPDFQQLEGAWRGLKHLVNNTETDEHLKIKVMNISKKALGRTLKRFPDVKWDQSPIFKRIYGEEFDQLGGHPYGCLVGDYHFDHSPSDVEMLRGIAKIAAASHAPFISGASPTVMAMDSWQELNDQRDLTKIFQTALHASWRSLRESEDARYLGLTLPRVLARLPYGANTDPVDDFDFEESTDGSDHSKYCWMNSAYAMAVNINRAFKNYGNRGARCPARPRPSPRAWECPPGSHNGCRIRHRHSRSRRCVDPPGIAGTRPGPG
jgi:type VI secretion system protein ImpC